MCTVLSILLPQAPGACTWTDVQHLLVNGSDSFRHFAHQVLCLTPLLSKIQCSAVLQPFCPAQLKSIEADWVASQWKPRYHDERQLKPVIHEMLMCAADTAQRTLHERKFIVLVEPTIDPTVDNRLADEVIVKVISENDLMRILLVVKGSNVFPKSVYQSQLVFSQLIQQVALGLDSELWK